jgi:hypothetical protein
LLRNGKWVPTLPNAKYIFHKGEDAAWEESDKRGENRPGGGGPGAGGAVAPKNS